jgi:hypothetical protein
MRYDSWNTKIHILLVFNCCDMRSFAEKAGDVMQGWEDSDLGASQERYIGD